MTEEEIRPIAEDYVEEYCHCSDGEYTDGSLVCAGIGTALIVSRQLEKQIQIDAEQIRALQKQNGELTDKVKELQEKLEQAEKVKVVEHFEAYGQCRDSRRIAELEAQIEKMRNCRNCKKNCEGYRNCTLQNLCYWEWDNGDIH